MDFLHFQYVNIHYNVGESLAMSDEETQNTESAVRGKPGRKRNENWLSWDEAKEFIRSEMIPSRSKYAEWWDRNKPKALPRFPYRVYTKEWKGWNDFLGNENEFQKNTKNWRPLDEAVLLVHKLKIESSSQWMEWCKMQRKAGTMPKDIPARPDLVYDKWRSWNHWLGNKPAEALEAKQQAQRVAIYYITHDKSVPENVFDFGVEMGGISALKDRWEREHFDIVKLFWYDQSKGNTIKQLVDALSVPYLGYDRQRVTPNVWELIWMLQVHLDSVTKEQLSAYATK